MSDRTSPLRCVFGLLLACNTAMAGDWNLSDSVTGRLSFVDRSGDGASSGIVMQISPRLSLSGRGARATANVNYGLTASTGSSDTNPQRISHDLVARGKLEAIEDLLYIDASASARLVGNSATSGSVDSINADSDGNQSYSLKISPSFRPRTSNRYVSLVSNNSLDLVDYTSTNGASGDGSTANTVNIGLQSGPFFTTYNWNVGVTQRTTSYEDRDDTRTDYSAGLGYRVDSRWRLNVRAGWEENDVQTDRKNTNGITWNLGGVWTPNPRTSATFDYGSRYFGETFTLGAKHRTKRTTLTLDASRDITNRRATRLVDSLFFLADEDGNPIVDPDSGAPIIFELPQLQETDEDYVNTQLRGAISVTGRRTNLTVSGNVANRKYEVSGGDEDSFGLALRMSRKLGNGVSASLNTSYDHAEGTNGGDSDTYDVGFGLSRSFTARTSVSLDVLHRQRDASSASGDYTENRIGVSLRSSFL